MNEQDFIIEEDLIKFNTFYKDNLLHSFQLSPKDSLIEVKQMQSESVELTLFPDFNYEFKGKVLDACTPIENILDIENQTEFNLILGPKKFDENNCTIHLQKVQVFVDDPNRFLATISVENQHNFGKLDIFGSFGISVDHE